MSHSEGTCYGYMGAILRINLSTRKVARDVLDMSIARRFIGGSGAAAYYLARETQPELDPYSPDSPLIFMTGPFTGTLVPTSGRFAVVAKSPLTGIWGESDAGGHWGGMLKRAGYDGVVVVGNSPTPVYLWIDEGGIEIRDASTIWGKDTFETEEIIKAETREKAEVACIGRAGENLVRYAAIVCNGRDARVAARCGLGAVMGSKNLKAIAVHGAREVKVADPSGLRERAKTISHQLVKVMKPLHELGTAGSIIYNESIGDTPIKNWTSGRWEEGAIRISGIPITENLLVGKFFCQSCPVGCGRKIKIPEDKPYGPVFGAGPEYESVAFLGAMLLVDNLNAVAKANDLCNRYGLDTISTGTAIAFAFEARELGLLGETSDGVTLEWGNPDALIGLIHQIAGRRGKIGNLLAEGVKRASEEIGGLALDIAIHTKGLELPGHDPRAYNSLAVSYATSNRGGCHLGALTHLFERETDRIIKSGICCEELGYPDTQDRFGVKGKGKFTADMQNYMGLFDALKVCKFSLMGGMKLSHLLGFLNDVTGWSVDIKEIIETGERIFNLKRLYNVSCGISRKDDTLPFRILSRKRKVGGSAENLPPLHHMLSEYYEARGWDEFGRPTPETVARLGLDEL